MKRFISTIFFSIACIVSFFMMGCGSSPLGSNDIKENDVTDNSEIKVEPIFRKLAITDIPNEDPDNPSHINYAYETSYTHWSGIKYGLKIKESGSNKFFHAKNCDWANGFYSDRIDYISDGGRYYSAEMYGNIKFIHTRLVNGKKHVDDRIHFIDKDGKKICVRLRQMFIHWKYWSPDQIHRSDILHCKNHDFQRCEVFIIGNTFFIKNMVTQQTSVDNILNYWWHKPDRDSRNEQKRAYVSDVTFYIGSNNGWQPSPHLEYSSWQSGPYCASLAH